MNAARPWQGRGNHPLTTIGTRGWTPATSRYARASRRGSRGRP
jgi:hypothetical protein